MDILQTIFNDVHQLCDWISTITGPDSIQDLHSKEFLSDFKDVYVGCPTEKVLFKPVSLSQQCHQYEIILRTMQKILKKKGTVKNVLVNGASMISENPDAHAWQNIEITNCNTSVNILLSTPWTKLLKRIGDEVMAYMLEHLSIFIEVKPTCFLQLTGFPVYEGWPFEKGLVLRLKKNTKKISTIPEKQHHTKAMHIFRRKRHSCSNITFTKMKKMENISGIGYDDLIGKSKDFVKQNDNKTLGFRPVSKDADISTEDVYSVKLREHLTSGAFATGPAVQLCDTSVPDRRHGKISSGENYGQKREEGHSLNLWNRNPGKTKKRLSIDSNLPAAKRRRIVTSQTSSSYDLRYQKNKTIEKAVKSLSLERNSVDTASRDENENNTVIDTQTEMQEEKVLQNDSNRTSTSRNTPFQPYNTKIILSRKKLLYYVNVREKISKEASMMSFENTPEGVLGLYYSIFVKTSEVTNKKVTVNPPSLAKVEAFLNVSSRTDLNQDQSVLEDQEGCSYSSGGNIAVTVSQNKTENVGRDCRVLPMLSQLLHNIRKCPYKALLNHYCPVNVDLHHRKAAAVTRIYKKGFFKRQGCVIPISRLLNENIHKRKVYLFMRVVLLRILPLNLVGGIANRNIILKNISVLVSMGKYDKISLGHLMRKLKTRNVDWLQDLTSNSCRLYLLSRLVYWLFINVIFVVLRTMFYVTDTTFLGYKLLYYRQSVWNRITVYSLNDLLKRNTVKPVSKGRVEDLLKSKSSLGISTLRFLPKQKSLRPIINMGVTVPELGTKKLAINKQLIDLHLVLTYLQDVNPSLIGYGKLGTDNVYTVWKQFAAKWKSQGQPKLYFVKTDITRCYDSILQPKLMEVMENIFNEEVGDEDLIVTRYVTVSSIGGIVRRRFQRKAFSLYDFEPDIESRARTVLKNKSNIIFVDKMCQQHVTGQELLEVLHEHITANLIKFGSKLFLHTEGISQGSVVSTLLCSFYYADMERKYFTVNDNSDFLARIVDDYLYVTPDHEKAVNFLQLMLNGIPEYNCFTNKDKVLANFYHNENSDISVFNEEWFPWCGMLFNKRSLEVGMEYDRYIGKNIADTLTFDLTQQRGMAMKEKLVYSVRQKCHSFFIDPSINSIDQIVRNLFYLYTFATLRFYVLVKKLLVKTSCRVTWGLMKDIINSLCYCVQRKVKLLQVDSEFDEIIPKEDLKWLCLHAFITKFKRHMAQFSVLQKRLENWRTKLEKKMLEEKIQRLLSVCGEKFPKEFELILY